MDKTINDIYNDYIKYLQLNYKVTTLKLINFKFKNYILPFFGNIKVKDINIEKYIEFQLYLKKFNYSNSFYEQIHIINKKFFDYMKMIYNIDNIPAKVGFKKNTDNYISNQKKGIWSLKEYKRFIRNVDNRIYHALFNVLFYTGLRKGEALSLKINDFNENYINVHTSITTQKFNGSRLITTTKTEKSKRIVKLDLFTKLELKKLIKYYSKTYDNFNGNFFLFGGDKPIPCTTLERKKNYYCKKAKVKQIRIHDFRHSHATLLYNKKIKIKLIQERLGHSDVSTTLNTYVHTSKNQQNQLIKKINFIRL